MPGRWGTPSQRLGRDARKGADSNPSAVRSLAPSASAAAPADPIHEGVGVVADSELLVSAIVLVCACRDQEETSAVNPLQEAGTSSDDADREKNGSNRVERCVPLRADHCQRNQKSPGHASDERESARSSDEERVEGQPQSQRGGADGGDVPGGERELCIKGPLDEGLDNLFADQECHHRKDGVDDNSPKRPPENANYQRGGDRKADGDGAEEVGELAPSIPRRWRPAQPPECGFLEGERGNGVSHDQSQNRSCEEAQKPCDPEGRARHRMNAMQTLVRRMRARSSRSGGNAYTVRPVEGAPLVSNSSDAGVRVS